MSKQNKTKQKVYQNIIKQQNMESLKRCSHCGQHSDQHYLSIVEELDEIKTSVTSLFLFSSVSLSPP